MHVGRGRFRIFVLINLLLIISPPCTQAQTKWLGRVEIGTVLGKPVYRDEITGTRPEEIEHQLQCLFLTPLSRQYQLEHAAELALTEEEIKHVLSTTFSEEQTPEELANLHEISRDAIDEIKGFLPLLCDECAAHFRQYSASLEADLQMPMRSSAVLLLNQWKYEKSLYEHYGGGRVVMQQLGYEAIEATRKWLAEAEAEGQLQIRDEDLRKEFFRNWDQTGQSRFLLELDDPEAIRTEFLEPDWVIPTRKSE